MNFVSSHCVTMSDNSIAKFAIGSDPTQVSCNSYVGFMRKYGSDGSYLYSEECFAGYSCGQVNVYGDNSCSTANPGGTDEGNACIGLYTGCYDYNVFWCASWARYQEGGLIGSYLSCG